MRETPEAPHSRRYRIAYLVTHPIQYQAPLLRRIAAEPDIDLTVFYQSDASLGPYEDAGFGRKVSWDVPLLEGYRHEFLPGLWRHGPVTAQRPLSWGFRNRLDRSRFDVLWVHGYARLSNWIAIGWARAHGLKVFVRDEATLFSASRSPPRRAIKRAFFKVLRAGVDAFLAIGSANRAYFRAQGVAAARIFDMPYCVDNEFFSARAEAAAPSRESLRGDLGLEAGRPLILYAAKFEPRKRPQDLLHAFEALGSRFVASRRPYLLYVGDGELRPALEAEAMAKGLVDVRFLGFRNQTELPALYDLCDVFVLPSVQEPWGLVVNEVMAVGRTVVVSDAVGCAKDLVHEDVNGFVYRALDVEALAEVLTKAIEDPQKALQMGTASRSIIADWSFRQDIAGLRAALAATIG